MKDLRILVFALVLLAAGCKPQATYVQITGYAQGGPWYVTCSLGPRTDAEAVKKAIDDTLSVIDWSVSGYNKGSLLTRLNAGENLPLDATFIELFNISRKIWEQTSGAFDPSCAPLFDIWGFGFTEGKMPSQQAVDSALAVVGMDRYSIYEEGGQSYLRRPSGGKLNFNAIAQGYTADYLAAKLDQMGTLNYLVEIGGEVYAKGVNPSGTPWNVGIDRPVDGNNSPGADIQAVVRIQDCGLVTSGDYRKFYIKDGKKISHSINPKTGHPVEHNLLSATVVAENATVADGYATYLMVLGLDKAREVVTSREGIEALLIYSQGDSLKVWMSDGMDAIVE